MITCEHIPTPAQPSPNHISRRGFVAVSGVGALAAVATQLRGQPAAVPPADVDPLIDVNVYVSHWPFRRLPCDETSTLVEKLRQGGVTQAWAGTFDGILHKDVRAANKRLAAECRTAGGGLLEPFGTVNPTLPDWQEDLRVCAEELGMPGVRLHPNYHDYQLDDPRFKQVLALASRHRLLVQIVLQIEDARSVHPLMRLKPVPVKPLLELLPQSPNTPVILLNANGASSREDLVRLLALPNVYTDLATIEGVRGLEQLLVDVPFQQVLFGSLAPYFYFESAKLKLVETLCTPVQLAAISHVNAARLLTSADSG